MSRDARTDEVRAWFGKAQRDLRAARVDLDADPPLLEDAAFHCQQAAEKAIKGLLVRRDIPFDKTHDIKELATLMPPRDADLQGLARRASRLTAYAWKYRYPGDEPEPSVHEIDEAVALAEEVVGTFEPRAMRPD
jgi:HEPN domain-containing protein